MTIVEITSFPLSLHIFISLLILLLHCIIHIIKRKVLSMSDEKTTIQVTTDTRDRLYKLKFRRTYDQFLNELCDLYDSQHPDEE